MTDNVTLSIALALVNLVVAVVGLSALIWKGGVMAEKLRRTEETSNKMASQWPRALERLTRVEERIPTHPRAMSRPAQDEV